MTTKTKLLIAAGTAILLLALGIQSCRVSRAEREAAKAAGRADVISKQFEDAKTGWTASKAQLDADLAQAELERDRAKAAAEKSAAERIKARQDLALELERNKALTADALVVRLQRYFGALEIEKRPDHIAFSLKAGRDVDALWLTHEFTLKENASLTADLKERDEVRIPGLERDLEKTRKEITKADETIKKGAEALAAEQDARAKAERAFRLAKWTRRAEGFVAGAAAGFIITKYILPSLLPGLFK